MKQAELARYIDHTLLAANATKKMITALCQEAAEHSFASVCVNGCWTRYCVDMLKDTKVKVCTVIGFPLGSGSTSAKVCEAAQALADGSDEIDMVINVGKMLDGDYEAVENDIRLVKEVCQQRTLKVILETCLLTDEQKRIACKLALKAKADFVKTSTGFSSGGATVADVKLMREEVKEEMGVKAAGGVRSYETALQMIQAGATRLGTSSGIAIIQGAASDATY